MRLLILLVVLTGCSADTGGDSVAFHFDAHKAHQIEATSLQAKPLPDSLLIEPGIYSVDGKTYQIEEGLFRLIRINAPDEQRISHRSNVPALLASITWLKSHGGSDDHLSLADLAKDATERKLVLTCGRISQLAQAILKEAGVESRIVTTLALGELNSYDNGHTMLEVKVDGKWLLYDLDNNVIFERNGQLSFAEFIEAVKTGDYEIKKLSLSPVQTVVNGDKDYTFYSEVIGTDLKAWYARIAQVGLIERDEKYYFPDMPEREFVEKYSANYRAMPPDEFRRTFY